jgi:hypothetical protein
MIRSNDRTLVLGFTQSGKSELVNHLLSGLRCQRVIVDTKNEWTVAGVEPVTDPAAIDWRAPVIHAVIEPGDLDACDRLFRDAYQRPYPVVVAAHELADLCDYQPNRTPAGLRRYLSMGATGGKGLLGASQRPVEMPKRGRTEADHIFMFVPKVDDDDLAEAAKMIPGVNTAELAAELDSLHEQGGAWSFLWFDRRTRELAPYMPLSEVLRSRTIVRRRAAIGGNVSAG